MNDTEYRYSLLAFFVAYFLFAVVWRSVLVYRRTGVIPFVLPSGEDAYSYVGRAFKLVVVGLALTVVFIAFLSEAAWWLGGFAWILSPAFFWTGCVLLVVSLLWLLVAQAQMGNSWRIGIDTQHHTELIQRGLFSVSRNPIFLAMRCTLLGLLFVFPAAATLVLLVAGEILMQVQVRLEEEHMSSLHGGTYAEYRSRVRRWL